VAKNSMEGRGGISMEGKGREGRFICLVQKMEGEGRELILIANMFGSRREWRNDKTKLLFYPYNFTRVS
jgi:hypothetical protein